MFVNKEAHIEKSETGYLYQILVEFAKLERKMDAQQLQNLTPAQKDELMKNVQAQVALANMQELLTVSFIHPWLYITFMYNIKHTGTYET